MIEHPNDYLSNEARKLASREATKAAVARELMAWSIFSRVILSTRSLQDAGWGAYLFKPAKEQLHLTYMLCIETPAGPLCWRLRHDHENPDDSEMPLFDHITDRREKGPINYQAGDKEALLLLLSTEGF